MESETVQSSKPGSEAGDEEAFGFSKSLQELRDLRSQLHYAADYCEASFLNSPEKKEVVENTQEYICRAVVTIVDHLGRVSSNLNDCFFDVSDADLRIQCLNQRLLSCQIYTNKLALAQLQWDPRMPRYHQRYLSKPISTNDQASAKIKDENTRKPSLAEITAKKDASSNLAVLIDGREAPKPTFHFQVVGVTQKRGRTSLTRKSVHRADHILSLIRRTKRAA